MNLSMIIEEAARFAVVEATEIQKLLEDIDSSNTKKATKVAVKLFNKYLSSREKQPTRRTSRHSCSHARVRIELKTKATIFTTAKLLLISELTELILF